jgi:hypothetical protein
VVAGAFQDHVALAVAAVLERELGPFESPIDLGAPVPAV